MKRLVEVKRGCLALLRVYKKMKETRKDAKINMPKKRNVQRSPESDSDHEDSVSTMKYEDRIRVSWFPPSCYFTVFYDSVVPPFLLSPPKN